MTSNYLQQLEQATTAFDQSFEKMLIPPNKPIRCEMELQDSATNEPILEKLFAETYLECYSDEDLGDFYYLHILFTLVLRLPKTATQSLVFEVYGQTLKLAVKDDLDVEEYYYKGTAYKKKHPVYAKFDILTTYLMLKIWNLICEKAAEEDVEIEGRDLEMLFNDMMYEELFNQLFKIVQMDEIIL